ncbi:transporter substrate-binding domain-containing protein [Castellaniella sp.]|uniref:transporter substrate-binding domain-containing protein n=1 Tax=Castellaniella sp. TaxID=1955812 RepID=UPI002AFF2078|nr:transporter substrate-binding domain-containing protein [Castellaniella sp.]
MFNSPWRPRAGTLIIGLGMAVALTAPLQAFAQDTEGWRLGVAQVPAAPVPGAKPRTPVRIELLAAQTTQGSAPVQAVALDRALEQLRDGILDAWVGVVPADLALPDGVSRRDVDWSASPLAILRTDTDIHDWTALAGRTVCLSADGRHVGELSARYAAIEQVYPAAADALLALRTGQCDAAVEDEGFLRELLKYPEWRKFSAQLAPYRQEKLTQLRRTDLPAAGRDALRQALSPAALRQTAREQAKAIAFEVYLDQTVPDCH